MALETGTYTNDLVATNPVPSDGLGFTDDHLRLIKSTLKNTFAGFTSAALASSQAQIDAAVSAVVLGTSNSYFKPGTAALPGLAVAGNVNTGIYQAAANAIGISTNGVQAVLIDASRNVTVAGGLTAQVGLAGATVISTGAYSGGTGQLVPIGSSHIWHEDVLPAEGGYCWANGGTLSRTTYPLLWARWGTKYGAGDGSTTFNVPNLCEVVPVGQRAMGSASSRTLLATGVLGNTTLGTATSTIATANLPPYTPAGLITNGTITVTGAFGATSTTTATANAGHSFADVGSAISASQAASTFAGTAQGGVSTPLAIVQPSMAVNFIIRIG